MAVFIHLKLSLNRAAKPPPQLIVGGALEQEGGRGPTRQVPLGFIQVSTFKVESFILSSLWMRFFFKYLAGLHFSEMKNGLKCH